MDENVYTLIPLLLLSFIRTGVTGEDGLIFAERSYNISAQDFICFHVWHFSTKHASDYIAIVTNGAIQTIQNALCKSKISQLDVTFADKGRVSPLLTTSPQLPPSSTSCLVKQCHYSVFSSTAWSGDSAVQSKKKTQIGLTWVDETGAQKQEDSQNRIKQQTACDITLTVTLQSPENKKFRCRATVDEQVQTSVELRVGVPALKWRGRGFIRDQEPQPKDHKQGTIVAAVGVVDSAILAVLVAAFVVNRRKARIQRPNESSYTINSTSVMNINDVIYADIVLPAGSDRV